MYGSEVCAFSFWWIFPLLMMVLCFFAMRGRWGSKMCGCCTRDRSSPATDAAEPATDADNQRNVPIEMDKTEHQ
jgi:hypothetical protein